jgi:ribosome-interacting GTPase 1
MAEDNMKAELERLRAENESLKKKKSGGRDISFKVSQKGAVSVYGMGRFPVTLYKEQWLRLLDKKDDIMSFIDENDSQLATKE